jgi:hypothetical protein
MGRWTYEIRIEMISWWKTSLAPLDPLRGTSLHAFSLAAAELTTRPAVAVPPQLTLYPPPLIHLDRRRPFDRK